MVPLVSADLGGIENGKNSFNIKNPSLTQEVKVEYASFGLSAKNEVKDIENGLTQKTKELSATALVFEAKHTETTTHIEQNGEYIEVGKKEENEVRVPNTTVGLKASVIVGLEVSFDWNKAAESFNKFINSVSK